MSVVAHPRKNRVFVVGAAALVVFAVLAAAGGYWWNERNKPSQASKADCVLAQKIIDEAQNLPSDKAAAEKWKQEKIKQRKAEMKDGYLGFRIAQYEEWSVLQAEGVGTPPSAKQVTRNADKANEHCAEALVTLSFAPIAS